MPEIHIAGRRVETHPAENPRYRSRLYLVHGLWAGPWCWARYGSFLAHRGWDVLAPELRGRPGGWIPALAPLGIDDYRERLEAVLATDRARGGDTGPPVLIGHDLGALLALEAGERIGCRAVVGLAPPLPEVMTPEYRRWLERTSGWGRWRVLLPPEGVEAAEARHFEPDSPRVARELLSGRRVLERLSVPVLLVAGRRDRAVDPDALREVARRIGSDFLVREAGHWDLLEAGFERQVDPIHRWLIRTAGAELLRLTGFEDLEES